MTSKELDQILGAFELQAKRIIEEFLLSGRGELEIRQAIQALAEKVIAKDQTLQPYLPTIFRSVERWIKRATPLSAVLPGLKQALAASTEILTKPEDKVIVAILRKLHPGKSLPPKDTQRVLTYLANFKTTHPTTGSPRIANYSRQLINRVKDLARAQLDTVTSDPKARMRIFAKVELDLRHSEQLKMLERARESGQDLFWISAHTDCSKRCEPYQGKLVSLSLPAVNRKHETGKRVDGYKVYSLTSIISEVDRYGYQNNIIVGFNCRHHLIPWKGKSHRPEVEKRERVRNYRELVAKQRRMERSIRSLAYEYDLQLAKDTPEAKSLKRRLTAGKASYSDFIDRHGLVNESWRFSLYRL